MDLFTERILDLAVKIQQISAPTFAEGPRAEFVLDQFVGQRLRDVSMDSLHNVFARLAGGDAAKPLIVSAHLDTVFPSSIQQAPSREAGRISGPGIGDNSLGVASLLGLIWRLQERSIALRGDVWLVANTCEEGVGDLRGMKTVVERFGADVSGYLIIEGTALGHVYHRAIGVRRYRVTARTAGGHSWSDYGQPSAVHELARLVTELTAMPVPSSPRTTLNVGVLSGGTGVNVLASDAMFELDVRSESVDTLAELTHELEARIWHARRDGVQIEMDVIGNRPAGEIPSDHRIVRLAAECLDEQGLTAILTSGSTDANVPLSRGIPAVVLGITTGGGAHTLHEYIDIAPIRKGMEQVVRFVERALNST